MQTVNYTKFHVMLHQALDGRSQRAFAQECGMLPQALNRLMKQNSGIPSVETLHKIAMHSSIPLADLLDVCGYPKTAFSEQPVMKPRITSDTNGDFLDAVHKVIIKATTEDKMLKSFESVDEMISSIIVTAKAESGLYKMDCRKVKENGNDTLLEFRGFLPLKRLRCYIVVSAGHTAQNPGDNGLYYLMRVYRHISSIESKFPNVLPKYIFDDPENPVSPDDTFIESKASGLATAKHADESSIMERLFRRYVQVPQLYQGIGFYMDRVDDETLTEFVMAHHDYITDSDISSEDDIAVYRNADHEDEVGLLGAVIAVIRAMTGIRHVFYCPSNAVCRLNRPVIMVPDDVIGDAPGDYHEAGVYEAMRRIAVELGVPNYGRVWIIDNALVPAEPECKTKQYMGYDQKLKLAEAKQDFADADSEEEKSKA